jgi:hypothetical protein
MCYADVYFDHDEAHAHAASPLDRLDVAITTWLTPLPNGGGMLPGQVVAGFPLYGDGMVLHDW